MPTNADPSKTEEDETVEDKTAADDAKLNAVVQSHLKRAMAKMSEAMSKTVGEQIAKAMEALNSKAPVTDEKEVGKDGKAGKADPALKLMQEELEKLKKQSADDRTARVAAEEKARKDGARTQLREALDAKGIKGARAAALISHLEATGSLRFTEDGEPILAVARSRAKGMSAEELEFDISAGVEDWSKTSEAAEFLPAPSTQQAVRGTSAVQRGQAAQGGGVRRSNPRYEDAATSEDEAARRTYEQLSNQGVNVDALLND
jgi:hypothetical protein